jgi:hypothetical protein
LCEEVIFEDLAFGQYFQGDDHSCDVFSCEEDVAKFALAKPSEYFEVFLPKSFLLCGFEAFLGLVLTAYEGREGLFTSVVDHGLDGGTDLVVAGTEESLFGGEVSGVLLVQILVGVGEAFLLLFGAGGRVGGQPRLGALSVFF